MSQDLYAFLGVRVGHKILVHIAKSSQDMVEVKKAFKPDVIICPFLTKRIPVEIYEDSAVPCLIVHPGVEGDRGISSIDWAMMHRMPEWGVTVLQAAEEMDAGDIWSTETFKVDLSDRTLTKSSFYRRYCIPAARTAVVNALKKYQNNESPRPLDYSNPTVHGRLMPTMKQMDRAVDFERMRAEEVWHRIRCADGSPGVATTISGVEVLAFGAHVEFTGASISPGRVSPSPGELIGKRHNAVLVRCAQDTAVWISHMKRPGHGQFKLPATEVLGQSVVGHLPELQLADPLEVPFGDTPKTFADCWYSRRQSAIYVHWEFYNGAMSTLQCRRLSNLIRFAGKDPNSEVVVLMGGRHIFSNGIDLYSIEASVDTTRESMRNILAIDEVVKSIFTIRSKVTISVFRGNAGAGGVMMGLATDRVIANRDSLFNPHYKGMNLFGSEYWTHFLPARVGVEKAQQLTEQLLPIGARHAQRIYLVDDVFNSRASSQSVDEIVAERVSRLHAPLWAESMNSMLARKSNDDIKFLAEHKYYEISKMTENFADVGYHIARHRFCTKAPSMSTTLLHLTPPGFVTARLMDGLKVSKVIQSKVTERAVALKEEHGVTPALAIVSYGHQPDSELYMSKKLQLAPAVGIDAQLHRVEEHPDAHMAKLRMLQKLADLNADESVHGIIVQLPVPIDMQADEILEAIDPHKDADAFAAMYMGAVVTGRADDPKGLGGFRLTPCTPRGIMELLNQYEVKLLGKKVLIIGQSRTVGMPLSLMMKRRLATVEVCNAHTWDLAQKLVTADVVISCAGKRGLVKAEWLKPGVVVVDVGIHVTMEGGKRKIVGDVCPEASQVASLMTPVPNGVGPKTVAMLMANTIELCEQQMAAQFTASVKLERE
eukprot:CAMPEP_0170578108 /NCGR_PEP_ID=MMETSP0224-20130122/5283_1 /TAXON_ID=285029 /ORGANISM="Togula jolla, Strain CCCM 725" /LENGTH=881 /DNA_ID=CAMNT_0010901061 /DNA_START=196 /DNA_END=2841 /DNA_ORIENTATION=-